MKKFYSFIAMFIMAAVGFVANAATASVYIDDKTGIYLYTNGDNWDRVESKLVNGSFVNITFTEGLTWNIDYNHQYVSSIYQLKRNGTVIAENMHLTFDVGYDFSVADGDVIEILVNEPGGNTPGEDNATVTLNCATGVITSISVDDAAVDFSDGVFQCPVGSMLFVYVNADNFTINSITLGDNAMVEMPETNGYYGIVETDATLAIDATPKTEASAALTVDHTAGSVYNLQGIQIDPTNITTGVYIINGKKTYIRK